MSSCEEVLAMYAKIDKRIKQREKRLYSTDVLVYYSPFEENEASYAYHVLYVTDQYAEDYESATVGNIILADSPYYLVENDIVIEFYGEYKKLYRVVKKGNKLIMEEKFCTSKENVFNICYLATFVN